MSYRKAKDAQGLTLGAKVEDFEAEDLHGEHFKLSDALKKGPIVLVFYRGQWCPICNKHLKSLQKNFHIIEEKGAQLIAVSPEKSEFLRMTAQKTKAGFRLLFDDDYQIAKIFDVDFLPGKVHRVMYNNMLGAKLKEAHSDDSERLPIPATFIINTDGVVIWRHFDPDYKQRSQIEDILANLP